MAQLPTEWESATFHDDEYDPWIQYSDGRQVRKPYGHGAQVVSEMMTNGWQLLTSHPKGQETEYIFRRPIPIHDVYIPIQEGQAIPNNRDEMLHALLVARIVVVPQVHQRIMEYLSRGYMLHGKGHYDVKKNQKIVDAVNKFVDMGQKGKTSQKDFEHLVKDLAKAGWSGQVGPGGAIQFRLGQDASGNVVQLMGASIRFRKL